MVQNPREDELVEAVVVLVSAVSSTLEKLDKIADRLADVAAFTEAIYEQQLQDLRLRDREDEANG